MLFDKITPEQAGLSSESLLRGIKFLENNGINLHSLLLMKGDKLFGEYYWAPFDKDFCHRMYSETKSFVGVAIGLLIEEGKLSLEDKVADFFPEKIDGELPQVLKEQTVRDMLNMRTCGHYPYWFTSGDPDRTHMYLNKNSAHRPSGTTWEYDSTGSQVLGNLVEKLSGQSLFDYLNDKIFKHLGTFKNATILKTPNGDSWGDSALICTSRDMISFGRFMLNYGEWYGKRLMNERYLKDATSPLVSNVVSAFRSYNSYGYGYQIWMHKHGFSFNGMCSQFMIAYPEQDVIIVTTADNVGYTPTANALMFSAFEEFVINQISKEPLPENKKALDKLNEFTKDLKLQGCWGNKTSPNMDRYNGVEYVFDKNDKGFKTFKLTFNGDGGVLYYENAQGKKELPFKMNENCFTTFPQFGYSNLVGGVKTTDGFTYKCATSGGWIDDDKFMLRVQIIDIYFGNMTMTFGFKGEYCVVNITKTAENFLDEYPGEFITKRK